MIAADHEKRRAEVVFRFDSSVDLPDDAVHLALFYDHVRTLWPALVANMIQPEIMQDQCVPVVPLELVRNVPGDVVVNLGEILLASAPIPPLAKAIPAHRDKEARGSLGAVKRPGE